MLTLVFQRTQKGVEEEENQINYLPSLREKLAATISENLPPEIFVVKRWFADEEDYSFAVLEGVYPSLKEAASAARYLAHQEHDGQNLLRRRRNGGVRFYIRGNRRCKSFEAIKATAEEVFEFMIK